MGLSICFARSHFEHRGQQTNIRETLDIRTRWFFWFGIYFNLTLKGVLRREWDNLKQLLDGGSRGCRPDIPADPRNNTTSVLL